MIAEPRRAYFGAGPETIKVTPSDTMDLFIECEVVSPPSMAGRTVHVRVDAEQLPAVLQAARRMAISARRTPLAAGDDG